MAWQDYYLWAGLSILLLNAYHLFRQRTLADKSTIIFNHLLIQGIIICVLGIVTSHLQTHNQLHSPNLTFAVTTLLYIIQALLPFEFFRLILARMNITVAKRQLYTKINTAIVLFFIAAILLNIPCGFIAYMEVNNYLYHGPYYYVFAGGLIAWHTFNFCYTILHRKSFNNRDSVILAESCLMLIIGSFVQYHLHINNSFGFAVALAIMSMQLTMKNSYAYIDIETRVFNAKYFDLWLRDHEHNHVDSGMLIIDLSKMLRTSGLYSQKIVNTLVSSIADQLWQLQNISYAFRLEPSVFVMLTKNKQEHEYLTEKILQLLQQCFFIQGKHISCHGTLISSTKVNDLHSVEQIMPYISFLLQQTQKQPNSQLIEDSDELLQEFVYEQRVESYLQHALENKLFQVYFQPAYSRRLKRFVSMEALSRLYIDKLGWISPELFMRLASNNGMILQIMPLQIENICKFVSEHRADLKDIETVKINLTPNEVIEPGYCQLLLDIIAKYKLPYSMFQFEIVESTATQYTAELENTVHLLNNEGISLCLDDFGSGYANLNTVMRLPFKVIKLDRSLLFGICQNKPAAIFYRSLVTTFKSLGYQLVAEGVENKAQADLLEEWQVDVIQGYYYAKPMPGDELIKMLNEKK